jgi:hypothetical protein
MKYLQGREHARQPWTVMKKFKVGDRVTWNSDAAYVSGTDFQRVSRGSLARALSTVAALIFRRAPISLRECNREHARHFTPFGQIGQFHQVGPATIQQNGRRADTQGTTSKARAARQSDALLAPPSSPLGRGEAADAILRERAMTTIPKTADELKDLLNAELRKVPRALSGLIESLGIPKVRRV